MHLEFRHLRTIKAIYEEGGLARAADRLHITQSALSHQIKGLEDQAGMELFVRRSKPMKLSAAGLRLLRLAEQVLPQVAAMEEEFRAMQQGKIGRLHIAIECHACFEWLLPVLEQFRIAWPDVDVDIRPGLQFEALPALMREEVDLVISSDPEALPGVDFTPLFDYEPVFVASSEHPLAAKPFIMPEDFRDELLITYPMERTRRDSAARLGGARTAPQRQLHHPAPDRDRGHAAHVWCHAERRHHQTLHGPCAETGPDRAGQAATARLIRGQLRRWCGGFAVAGWPIVSPRPIIAPISAVNRPCSL